MNSDRQWEMRDKMGLTDNVGNGNENCEWQ